MSLEGIFLKKLHFFCSHAQKIIEMICSGGRAGGGRAVVAGQVVSGQVVSGRWWPGGGVWAVVAGQMVAGQVVCVPLPPRPGAASCDRPTTQGTVTLGARGHAGHRQGPCVTARPSLSPGSAEKPRPGWGCSQHAELTGAGTWPGADGWWWVGCRLKPRGVWPGVMHDTEGSVYFLKL